MRKLVTRAESTTDIYSVLKEHSEVLVLYLSVSILCDFRLQGNIKVIM